MLIYILFRMVVDIRQLFTEIADDNNVLSIVISGAGRVFTAGLDCKLYKEKGVCF